MSENTVGLSGTAAVILLCIGLIFWMEKCQVDNEPANIQRCQKHCKDLGAPTWSYDRRKAGCICGGPTE